MFHRKYLHIQHFLASPKIIYKNVVIQIKLYMNYKVLQVHQNNQGISIDDHIIIFYYKNCKRKTKNSHNRKTIPS